MECSFAFITARLASSMLGFIKPPRPPIADAPLNTARPNFLIKLSPCFLGSKATLLTPAPADCSIICNVKRPKARMVRSSESGVCSTEGDSMRADIAWLAPRKCIKMRPIAVAINSVFCAFCESMDVKDVERSPPTDPILLIALDPILSAIASFRRASSMLCPEGSVMPMSTNTFPR